MHVCVCVWFNILPVLSTSFSPHSVRYEGHTAFPRILLPVAFVLLCSWDSTLWPCCRDFLLHIFFTLISLPCVILCPSTLYRPDRRTESWIWRCKEKPGVLSASHEIPSITRLCPYLSKAWRTDSLCFIIKGLKDSLRISIWKPPQGNNWKNCYHFMIKTSR